MNLSAYCIDRPIATTLLTLGLALAGLLAFFQLPVAPLPQIDFPTISVQASLPGASPENMAATVATPLERALGTIAGVTEMTSSSSFGATSITLQFDLARDIDGAARDVQAAINAASSLLPSNLPSRPRYRKVNPADTPIMILALTSPTLSRVQLYDAAATILAQKIAQIEGVGQVTVAGSSLPAVRIELNPTALARYGISLAEVRGVITAANVNRPKGSLEDDSRHWQIFVNDQAKTARDYLPLIIKQQSGAVVRLADVGTATDSAEDLRNAGFVNGKAAVLLVLNKQSGANIIATVDKVNALLPQLQASIPSAIDLNVVMDRSGTIRASLHEVERSLLIAIALVIVVVLLFLRDFRSALIPIITVPLSLLGTFAVMYVCHYSLDNLSLMALTVATGFVVDDAIVVVENTARHIELGVPPRQAALKATREVSFTVLTMSLSLVAVFIPILFMGGIVGRMFQEFAVTLSAAVAVSLVIALTTTPMLCAWLLKPVNPSKHGHFYQLSESGFKRLTAGYARSLRWALQHRMLMLVLLAVTVGCNVYLYQLVPKGFFPTQDTGRLGGHIQADQNISSQAMQQKLAALVKLVAEDTEVETVLGFTGGTGGSRLSNSGQMFAILKPLAQRQLDVEQLLERLRRKLSGVPGAKLYLQPAQEIRVGARGSGAMFEYTLQAEQLSELRIWTPQIVQALSKRPELADVNADQQDKGQQVTLSIDYQAAASLGVSQALINSTLQDAFSQRQVSVIYTDLNQYHVVMEVAPEYSQSAEALKSLYVSVPPNPQFPDGAAVPLAAFAKYAATNTPLSVNHQGQFPATTLSFNLKPGISLSMATQLIDEVVADLGVPASVRGDFQGTAKAFQQSLSSQPWLVLSALLVIYIVLGILYESYFHPLTILSTLPSAGVGAILALLACKIDFTIIALIGVILLIGIVKKNAIMMIDFAVDAERTQGIAPEAAIYSACLMRFRPIMMTTVAALFAALPLALGTGYGAELRRPLGIAIIGGLLFSQLLTLYTTPVIYIYLDRLQAWCRRSVTRKRWQPQADSWDL
ncbi:MAG: multidrug efflux RND transporter permease subunit [Methylococcaceae bacterium]|nr:multidrug efflux RND transporter permease subunit [Methylococcaceae bacterium]